ncbi:MAG: hypothetical protein AAB875_00520 [Patescibacteria group bacterium]
MSERLRLFILESAAKAISRSKPEILAAKKKGAKAFRKERELAISKAFAAAIKPARRYASKMDYLILEDVKLDLRERAAVSIAQSAADGAYIMAVEPPPQKPVTPRYHITLNGNPHYGKR